MGDVLDQLALLPDGCVHTVVTSPPYWNLRDYGVAGQLGLERTPEEYIAKMVEVFRQVRRVLRDDGTCWINMGDSYAGYWGERYSHKPFGDDRTGDESTVPNKVSLDFKKPYRPDHALRARNGGDPDLNNRNSTLQGGKKTQNAALRSHESGTTPGLKPKDLIGVPWMLAFALRADGWYLRSDIIWSKSNCVPESVTDRPTKSHEYIFLLSKSRRYFYDADAIKTPVIEETSRVKYAWGRAIDGSVDDIRKGSGEDLRKRKSGNKRRQTGEERDGISGDSRHRANHVPLEGATANKRTVWQVPAKGFLGAHFAVFPQELIIDCIRAGSSAHGSCATCGQPYGRQVFKTLVPLPKAAKTQVIDARDHGADPNDQGSNRQKDGHKNGHAYITETVGWEKTCKCATTEVVPCIVLDPFFGAGTTGLVARKLHRDYIGIELNPKYVKIARDRLYRELGAFI